MRRRLWIVPVAAVLVLAAAHAALWRYEAGQLDAGWSAWLAERRAAGWTAHAGTPELGGWPLAATLSLPDVSLQGGARDIPGGLSWRTGRLDLRVELFSPGTLQLQAAGPQRLRVAGLPEIAATAASVTALLPLQADAPPRAVSLTIRDLRAEPAAMPPDAAVSVGLVQFDGSIDPAASSGQAALTYRLSAEAIALPAARSWALGSRISSLLVEGDVTGPVPLVDAPVPRATAWRDGGGTLRVQHLAMGWGPLGLSGAATLALDAHLQPIGSGSVHLVGYAAALDALANGRVLAQGTAIAAKAVLSLLAAAPEDGGPAGVEVPLTLQDRILSMRQVPLLRLPELIWPEP